MNPIKQPVEQSLSQNARDRWLRERYDAKDWNGLYEAAVMLNTLYHMERTVSLGNPRSRLKPLRMYGLDRDSA
jgi:hypothetical protein